MPTVQEVLQHAWKKHQGGQLHAAEQIYRQVLDVAPADPNAWCFLGMACHDQGRYQEAVEAYDRALELKPAFPIALSNLGNTLKEMGRLEAAIQSCQEALRLKPDYSTAYNNLGAVYAAQGELDQAADCFERALELMPDDAVTHANLGATRVRQGDLEAGSAQAEAALRANPRFAEAHKNQAIIWLLKGDFERGWPKYEWRFQTPTGKIREVNRPRWQGEPLQNRTILLLAEQGLGDTLQFMRYGKLLRQGGTRIILACQAALHKLIAEADCYDQLVDWREPPPECDYYVPLLSIPGMLQTDLHTIPADIPYLTASAPLVAQWRQRLDQRGRRFRIGIAWQGNPDFHADALRSVPLRFFSRLAAAPDVEWVSLQKGDGVDQIAPLQEEFPLVDFGDELDSEAGPFMDTAAIMSCVDLVITSDTSLTHLAGALGVPTWVALSYSPDWRWLLDREDSPWYPTMRLFRQQQVGEWDGVFDRISQALQQHLAKQNETVHSPKGVNVNSPIMVEVAPGELIDKITILEIKSERITDADKLKNVKIELDTLVAARNEAVEMNDNLADMTRRLKAVNERLWDIEDDIRDCERRKDFGNEFVELARSVYRCNDERAAIKREVNDELGSRIVEEKSYQDYE